MTDELTPFRNIPIRITVDGVEVTGEVVYLTPNDMSVVISSPVSGLGTGLHYRILRWCTGSTGWP